MPKSKKFIDRKNAVTFHLVHRSQQDPLVANEDAPQHVLVQAGERQKKVHTNKTREEQRKFGIFFDDDYDYMQHLRESLDPKDVSWERVSAPQNKNKPTPQSSDLESGTTADTDLNSDKTPRLTLPSSVFASEVEESVGLLNKAAPHSGLRLDLDPDIIMAMDEDFDFENPENELEDNFMELANANGDSDTEDVRDEQEDEDVSSGGYSSEEQDDVGSLEGPHCDGFMEEETRSRFTEYSMSSSVLRRNQQLTLVDERFERMFAGYEENEIGSLDMEDIEGHVNPESNLLLQYAEEFEKDQARQKLVAEAVELRKKLILDQEEDSSGEEDLVLYDFSKKDSEKWDCESILSTYSTLYNHPKLITEPKGPRKIQINPRTGIPDGVLLKKKGLTTKALAQHTFNTQETESCAESVISKISTLSLRPKNETPAERKQRKLLLREYRKERRLEKKANAEAFKEEKKIQEKIMLNCRSNVQGIK